jgi:hypothetical protein
MWLKSFNNSLRLEQAAISLAWRDAAQFAAFFARPSTVPQPMKMSRMAQPWMHDRSQTGACARVREKA